MTIKYLDLYLLNKLNTWQFDSFFKIRTLWLNLYENFFISLGELDCFSKHSF